MALPMPRRGPPAEPAETVDPRLINVSLGLWLFASAFLWPESRAQATNTWISGVLCVAFSFASMAVPWARYLTSALGVWLYVSAWMLPIHHVASLWNHVLCSIAIFVVSLAPSDTTTLPGGLGRLARSS